MVEEREAPLSRQPRLQMNLEQEFARDLVELLDLPDSEAATALNGRMLAIERVEQLRAKSFAQRGLIAVEFQRRELFKRLNFETFSDWIRSGFMGSRSSIYDAKRDIEALQEDIPPAVLANIAEKSNLKALVQCSSGVRRSATVQEMAQGSSPEDFVAHLQEHHAEQHIELRIPVRFFLEKSEAETLEAALKATMDAEDLPSREAALESWAASAIAEYSSRIEVE
jgi:hypothetical protein